MTAQARSRVIRQALHDRVDARFDLQPVFLGRSLPVLVESIQPVSQDRIAGGVLFTDPATITAIPQGLFGSLLLVVAAELILHGARTDAPLVTGLMAVIAIPAGMAAAFVAGLMLAAVTSRKKYRQKGDETAGIPGKKE